MPTFNDLSVLTSSALIDHLRANGRLPDFPLPHTVIFAPQKSLAREALRRHAARQIKGFLGDLYLFKRPHGQIALSCGFGIGAPAIASLADEFAALGVRRFALIGLAGGLQPELTTGNLVVATGAIRGEGVSRHYLPPAFSVEASAELVQGISQVLTAHHRPHVCGITWTTDAPFRELRREVLERQRQGVLTVEMEAAGLFAVAQACSLPAVALFSIADQLTGGEWHMADDLKPAYKGLSLLFEAAFEYFTAH
jgi:uridine phosphorylase